ncbi:UDP-N-acetylglucosamine--undecaprenyl-phosphate N-acetylglucosaminephosphotransferase [Marinobacter sp. HL-58]|uniref:UDP-N-acetylglucosamine--undecaprenyl-phosphate N-acetylglucosaminephosphotransferase n=1 Tax=Marinobacter sp. HL-58 TaxID=1479237 RepID=UPI00068C5A1B|nr:UDP-N-acetylglucosamine--undecaprenyl-phosphate N-acetylglucosaminephosphotransferase [Marinobacter sp. HL-58]KPP97780.1 MAG: UDP-GlcNAc:undecaprenyl-phosphate GlcNAc-1-phosphate transferase [Marinobacter sp. HL-58]
MSLAYVTLVLAGLFAWMSLVLLKPIAVHVQLVDVPDQRKLHFGAVPLVGGLSVFFGLLLAWILLMPLDFGYGSFFLCSFALVMIGAVDDARNLPAGFRLLAQVLLAIILIAGSGLHLNTFGNLLGFGPIHFGVLVGSIITVAAIIGSTNAFNMMDGIDGLAGSMSLVALLSLAYLFSQQPGFELELVLSLGISAALVPYLAANLRLFGFRQKIFMGDAGSIFIGFAIVWLLINGTQADAPAMRPVTALWVIALPLMDMVSIMVRRARNGQPMMRADREHLHHVFLRAGFNQTQALVSIVGAASLLAMAGILGELFLVPEWLMFASFLGLFTFYSRLLGHIGRLRVLIHG